MAIDPIMLCFFAAASLSAPNPSCYVTQQPCAVHISTNTTNSISNIAIKTPHSSLTRTLAAFGFLCDLSSERPDVSLVNSARTLSTWPDSEARKIQTWVVKQKRVSWE
ncbi:hypothetical protein NL676_010867 [Syzygium grande]|nr:hypothetical protein NL676_010867 [Syzygium grande]